MAMFLPPPHPAINHHPLWVLSLSAQDFFRRIHITCVEVVHRAYLGWLNGIRHVLRYYVCWTNNAKSNVQNDLYGLDNCR